MQKALEQSGKRIKETITIVQNWGDIGPRQSKYSGYAKKVYVLLCRCIII